MNFICLLLTFCVAFGRKPALNIRNTDSFPIYEEETEKGRSAGFGSSKYSRSWRSRGAISRTKNDYGTDGSLNERSTSFASLVQLAKTVRLRRNAARSNDDLKTFGASQFNGRSSDSGDYADNFESMGRQDSIASAMEMRSVNVRRTAALWSSDGGESKISDAEEKRPNSRPRKQLLIGYLAGTPFANLGEGILAALNSAQSKSNSSAMSRLMNNLQSKHDGRRARRMAEPYPDPDAYPDPEAYPDAYPLEKLHVVNANTTIKLAELAKLFYSKDIIGTSKNLQGHAISGAMRYALEVVNNDPTLLPDYELTFKFFNTRGLTKESVKAVMELWRMGAVAFIGPEDSCQTEATMAAAQNLPMISYKCADHSVSDKQKYGTFARTVPAEGEVAKATVAFLRHYHWYRFTIIHQADEVHRQLVDGIVFWTEKSPGMTVQNRTSFRALFNIDTKSSSDEVKQIVEETYQNTRIYVVLGDQGFVQLMLLEMDVLDILSKGEYAIVYVDHTYGYIDADDAAMNRYYRPTIHKHDDNSTNAVIHRLMELSRSLFVVIPTPVSFSNWDYQQFWNKVVQYNTEEPFKLYRAVTSPPLPEKNGSLNTQQPIHNRYASYLYDAVLLYAQALHEVIEAKGNMTNGTAIIQRILGRKYRSMQGFDITIDFHGDAKGNFTLLARQNISNSRFNFTHSMVPTAWFIETSDVDDLPAFSLHDKMNIDWIRGKPPIDEPECGFHNEHCIKEPSRTAEIAGSVIAVLSLVSILIGFMIYRNWKIEKELAGLIWKIDPKEIQFITQDGYAAVLGASRTSLATQDSTGQETESLWPIDFHCLAKYRGALVAIKEIQYARKVREITRATKVEMKKMRGLHHDNVNSFMGIIIKTHQIYVVREYCAKGSLYDVLLNDNIKLDDLFTASFIDDLLKAMCYLHESELRVHGNLKSTNCVVTSRWSLQVSDYGLHELKEGQQFESDTQRYKALLWTAPELLLAGAIDRPQRGTQKGDVFSFGIVLHEIFSRTGPYGIESDYNFTARDIYMLIIKTRQYHQGTINALHRPDDDCRDLGLVNTNAPYLPNLEDIQCQNYVKETMLQCWDERPNERPDFRTVRQRLKPLFKGILRRNIMDHMMAMMEKYQNHLEQLVDERTEALNEEKRRVETLLHRMLPYSVGAQLMRGEDVIPESYDAVTIYFSDIVGFTSLSAESTPMEVVNFLNALYTLFDGIIRRYDVYKVETIGDAYMVVSGLPIRNGDKHAGEIATMALHLLNAVDTFEIPHRPDKKLLLRIGLHTGPCVAGVVGKTMPRYCLFGDTVNTANRMESNGLPLKIHCSEYVERALSTLGGYILEERGLVPMKGKGEMLTYWLLAKQEFVMASPVDELPAEPLFKTKDAGRPPTGNIGRRRVAPESINQMPVRGESLTTVIRRTPSKRTDASSSATSSKLLQPAPAFSSTAGKASATIGGGGSSRNSRTLLPCTADCSSSGSQHQSTHQGQKPLLMPASSKLPPSINSIRTAALKRPSLRDIFDRVANGSCRLKRQGSSDSRKSESGLRKRSVSFPENVQALAEQFVASTLTKDGGAVVAKDANGNVAVDSSPGSSSLLKTPSGRSIINRRRSPDSHSMPGGFRRQSHQIVSTDLLRRLPSDGLRNSPGRWEKFDSWNGNAPLTLEANESPRRQRNSKLINLDDKCNDNVEVPRKRSLSCGDATNLAMITKEAASDILASDHSSQRLLDSSVLSQQLGNSAAPQTISGDWTVGRRGNNSLRDQRRNSSNVYSGQNALLMENRDEDDCLLDSPLLFRANTSSCSVSGPSFDRHKKKRKSAISLQAFSRPFHSILREPAATSQDAATSGLIADVGASQETRSGLSRFLRYLRRPLSEETVEISGSSRLPRLV